MGTGSDTRCPSRRACAAASSLALPRSRPTACLRSSSASLSPPRCIWC
jgi:hypothetical protein